jgi:hypothetical protein
VADSLVALDSTLARVENGSEAANAVGLVALNEQMAGILDTVEGADAEPTTQVVAAASELERALDATLAQWSEIKRMRLRTNR